MLFPSGSACFLALCFFVLNISQFTDNQVIEENSDTQETATEDETYNATQATSTSKPHKETLGTATNRPRTTPCVCTEGACKCCTGAILNRFNYTQRNKACVNINYEPDDFEFQYKLMFNDRVLLQNKISGKSPRPVCIPVINRFFPGNLCLKFSNVYMIGRNFHACLELDGVWNEQELFGVAFDCFRIGTNGIAIVKPEDGGGLPTTIIEETLKPEEEDYDDSARTIHSRQ